MRVLVTGVSGLLGSRVARLCAEKGHEVIGTFGTHGITIQDVDTRPLDFTDPVQAFEFVREAEPDAVLHCAAITNVDECEQKPELAMKVNGLGTENLAMVSREMGCHFIYVSTDYVFDGIKGNYAEYDQTNPVNVYGQSKLRGELAVRGHRRGAITRMSVIYGWNEPHQHANFATWMIDKLKKNEEVNLLTDQLTSPTLAEDAADVLLRMLELRASGVYHVCGKGCVSRYDFGLSLADVFGLDKSLIKPTTSDKLKWVAKRPANSCLATARTEKELGIGMRTPLEGLNRMKELGN